MKPAPKPAAVRSVSSPAPARIPATSILPPTLLSAFDDDFRSGVDLATGNLTFTVIRGEVLGNFEASARANSI